jgi:tetratricopeptide (TPR) repeat protein
MINISIIQRWGLAVMAALLMTLCVPEVSARKTIEGPIPEMHGEDSVSCTENISLYKALYLDREIVKALGIWRTVLAECPSTSEDIYADGESMYKELFSSTGKTAYVDSMLMVITQRTYFFNGKPENDLRKSDLLFTLAGDDPAYLGLCYNILIEVAESWPDQMDCSHFVLLATVAASLYAMDIIDAEELTHSFVKAISTVDARLESNPANCMNYEDLENMETFFLTSGVMTCADIELLYSQKIDRNFRDTVLVNKIFSMLTEAGCTGSDLYYNVAVKMFANDRSAANAVRLAELNVGRNNIERAISYFNEAYNRDTSSLVRSGVITRVAAMELSQGKRQEARNRAEHAWQLNKRNGEALLILADCYAGASFGNDFDDHSAYWVAVDYLRAAREVDPTLTTIADEKISAYSMLFPTREECFYRRILDEGVVYNVGGWINEITRVRFRRE